MKTLTYISLLIPFLTFGQKVTQVKYYHLLDVDSVFISQHSSWRGAYNNALAQTTVQEKDTFYIKGDITRLIVDHRKAQILPNISELKFNSISQGQITSTSVKIFVELSRNDHEFVYVRFRKEGGAWQETNRAKDAIFSNDNLVPSSNYEYQVFAVDHQGIEINSPILTFRTP